MKKGKFFYHLAHYRVWLIITLFLIAGFVLGFFCGEKVYTYVITPFSNTDGQFDYGIFWSAFVGLSTVILALVAIHLSKQSNKLNRELFKQQVLSNMPKFKQTDCSRVSDTGSNEIFNELTKMSYFQPHMKNSYFINMVYDKGHDRKLLINYQFKNITNKIIDGLVIYSITIDSAEGYFKKVKFENGRMHEIIQPEEFINIIVGLYFCDDDEDLIRLLTHVILAIRFDFGLYTIDFNESVQNFNSLVRITKETSEYGKVFFEVHELQNYADVTMKNR